MTSKNKTKHHINYFIFIENSSSSIFDDSDAEQTYNPFYIKKKITEVCSNNSPDCIEASIDSFGNLHFLYSIYTTYTSTMYIQST